jgi:hypothetical protein
VKLSTLSSMGLVAMLLVGTATAASALNFDFSFSDDGSLGPFDIPGTVTGEITGLTDNATSAATHVYIDTGPSGLLLAPPFDTIGNTIFANSFTVSGGQITDANYFATDAVTYAFGLNTGGQNSLNSFEINLITGNSGGFGGVTYTAAPEPSTWAMMLIGFAGLGYAGHRARRSALAA